MNLRKKNYIIIFMVILLMLTACQQRSSTVKVIKVIDGDTIIIEGGYYVRYIGIDTPERDEEYYMEAKQINQNLVEFKSVRLEKDITDKDKYGRLLRYVFVDDTFINAEITRQGYAYAKAYSPDTKYQTFLESMEKEARQTKKGVWTQQ